MSKRSTTQQHPTEDHPVDVFERGLAFDVQTLMSRRRALITMGSLGLGALGLAACSSDESSSDPTAGTQPEATQPSATTAGTTAGSASTTSDAGSSSASTEVTTASTDAAALECVDEIPDETQGPFPGDGSNGLNVLTEDGIVRRDIRASFGTSTTVAEGIPLEVVLTIQDAAACAPLGGAAVYVWHCDANGNYSMYSDAVTDENYLRGVQEADANGQVRFTTVVPGCYSGRWPHIHFEVYEDLASATAGSNSLKTSQLAFPQAMCEMAYGDSRYPASAANLSRISLSSDGVFGEDGAVHQLAAMSGDNSSGYTATLSVGV